MVVRTYGDTVIETSRGGALRFTNVWVMSDGQWRTAAVHLSLITDEAAAQSLVGAWTLEEAEITGGDNPRTFADRSGLMIFTATHYSQVYVTGNERPQLGENATDAERLAAFTPFIANGGTYTLDGSTLTLQLSVAKNPNAMNATRTSEVRFEGDDTVWFTFHPPASP